MAYNHFQWIQWWMADTVIGIVGQHAQSLVGLVFSQDQERVPILHQIMAEKIVLPYRDMPQRREHAHNKVVKVL